MKKILVTPRGYAKYGRDTYGGHSKLKTKRSFYLQPKQQLFAKLNAKEVKIPKENKGE